jgi:hypothetical protein
MTYSLSPRELLLNTQEKRNVPASLLTTKSNYHHRHQDSDNSRSWVLFLPPSSWHLIFPSKFILFFNVQRSLAQWLYLPLEVIRIHSWSQLSYKHAFNEIRFCSIKSFDQKICFKWAPINCNLDAFNDTLKESVILFHS